VSLAGKSDREVVMDVWLQLFRYANALLIVHRLAPFPKEMSRIMDILGDLLAETDRVAPGYDPNAKPVSLAAVTAAINRTATKETP